METILIEIDNEHPKAYETLSCGSIESYITERNVLSSLQSGVYDPSVELIVEDESRKDFFDFLSKIGETIGKFFSSIFDFMKQHLLVLVAVALGIITVPVVITAVKGKKVDKSVQR